MKALLLAGCLALQADVSETAATPGSEYGSYLTSPLYLSSEPPPVRSLRRLLVRFDSDSTPLRERAGRDRDAALRLIESLAVRADAGIPFVELVREHGEDGRNAFGGVLGSFASGMLRAEVEEFLWSAEIGALSPVFERPQSFEILQRIKRHAACRTLEIPGDDEAARARALELKDRLSKGESFADIAREFPTLQVDEAVFERGPEDRLLKRAIFDVGVGELLGPMESFGGLILAQRIATEEIERDRWPTHWIRARCIFIAHKDVGGSRDLSDRTLEEAGTLAVQLEARLREGADMAQLAAEYDDDRDGRRRSGDLGWLYRYNNQSMPVLKPLFRAAPGELLETVAIEAGWLILRREE